MGISFTNTWRNKNMDSVTCFAEQEAISKQQSEFV
jgi:hypothetical protein